MAKNIEESNDVVNRAGFLSRLLGSVLQDVRFSIRHLVKYPAFAAGIILTLAVAIGPNTTVFSILNAIALRPMPVQDPASLVRVYRFVRDEGGYRTLSHPDYVDLLNQKSVFKTSLAWSGANLVLSKGTSRENVRAYYVSSNYFSELGAQGFAGRTFSADDDQSGQNAVAVLGERFSIKHFGSVQNALGQPVSLNGQILTIVGVAPQDFRGMHTEMPDLWVPLGLYPKLNGTDILSQRGTYWLNVASRLQPGVPMTRAQAAVTLVAEQLAGQYTQTNDKTLFRVTSASYLTPDQNGEVVVLAIVALGFVGMILAIACANIASLLLSRSSERTKEIAIRLAIGATSRRIVQQMVTETALLALVSGAVGLVLSLWLTQFIQGQVEVATGGRPMLFDVSLDWRMLAFTTALSVVTGIIFGLAPALQCSRPNLVPALKAEGSSLSSRISTSRLRDGLVVIQIALCLVLLIGGGLLVRALHRAQNLDTGFDMKRVVVVIPESPDKNAAYDQRLLNLEDLVTQVRALNGVTAASLALQDPLGSRYSQTPIFFESQAGRSPMKVQNNTISSDYFKTLNIPFVRGVDFGSGTSGGSNSVIINETMARKVWNGDNPLGKRIRTSSEGPWFEVIGVVRDTRSTFLWELNEPYVYFHSHSPARAVPADYRILAATSGARASMVTTLRESLQASYPALHLTINPLEDNLSQWIWPSQIGAALSFAFGVIALYLAAQGIYSVVAYAVRHRTREIGIRLALGATDGMVLSLFFRQAFRLLLAGTIFGLIGAALLTWALSAFLYGISSFDLIAFCAAVLFLALVVGIAIFIPARAAVQVDPMTSLRDL